MSVTRTGAYEHRHIRCAENDLQAVIGHLELFYWEVIGTNTVVSKESHLEPGGVFDSDTIYSVTTEERFCTLDVRRDKCIDNYDRLRGVESRYIGIVCELERLGCSAHDGYTSPPAKQFSKLLLIVSILFYVVPGILYWLYVAKKHAERCARHEALKAGLDGLVAANRDLLNG
jgi:hypothetical protein